MLFTNTHELKIQLEKNKNHNFLFVFFFSPIEIEMKKDWGFRGPFIAVSSHSDQSKRFRLRATFNHSYSTLFYAL